MIIYKLVEDTFSKLFENEVWIDKYKLRQPDRLDSLVCKFLLNTLSHEMTPMFHDLSIKV